MIALLLGTVLLLCLFTGCVSKNQIPQTEQSAQTNEHAKTDGADLAEKEEMPVALRLVMFGDLSPRREEYFKTDFHDAERTLRRNPDGSNRRELPKSSCYAWTVWIQRLYIQ